MKLLLDEGRHVVTDNWYTSLRLAHYLLTRDTMITGVVRSDRGPPNKLVITELPKKSQKSSLARNKEILICKYEDKKTVYCLTSYYHAHYTEISKAYFGHVHSLTMKPGPIDNYNKLMGSVDKAEPYSF